MDAQQYLKKLEVRRKEHGYVESRTDKLTDMLSGRGIMDKVIIFYLLADMALVNAANSTFMLIVAVLIALIITGLFIGHVALTMRIKKHLIKFEYSIDLTAPFRDTIVIRAVNKTDADLLAARQVRGMYETGELRTHRFDFVEQKLPIAFVWR